VAGARVQEGQLQVRFVDDSAGTGAEGVG